MAERQAIVTAIETYCRAETDKDRVAWMALFADDIVHEDPVGIAIRHGREGLAELWEMVARGDAHLWLTGDVIVRGNEAIALMACETGAAGARRRTAPIVDHFVFDDAGKIKSVRAFYEFG